MNKEDFIVLSIKFGGHDTSAALMINGTLIAACEQERYTLDKHSRLFPNDAIADCLKIGGINIDQVNELAFVNDLKYFIRELYLRPALTNDDRLRFLMEDIDNLKTQYYMDERIRKETNYKGEIKYYRHHLCHLASSYFPSGFEDALLVSYDGMAELETGMIAIGKKGNIEITHDKNLYPHSLGLLYSAITFYLGWRHHYDEGIIMGLAPYGNPNEKIPSHDLTYYEVFKEILQECGPYDFIINQDWMAYYRQRDVWVSDKFKAIFGPKRNYDDELTQHHKNIAAALQYRLEEVILKQLKHAKEEYGISKLCLAGGVALNCSMNGKVMSSGIFDDIFVQPAAGDAGTTIGACYLAQQAHQKELKPKKMHNFYLGSRFNENEIKEQVETSQLDFSKPKDLYSLVAERLKEGKIVSWFQGAAEFGPRALGNRSILCRPFPVDMKDYINARVKFREEFRPFAPAVLAEYASEYFQIKQESPHMLYAQQAQPSQFDSIAATVHVDNSCRVQTVKPENNERFYKLIQAFHKLTGIPVILNTSFNVKGQPIVNTPEQAISCYQSTNLDCLVIGEYFVEKK